MLKLMIMPLMIFIVSCKPLITPQCDISFNPKSRCRCRCMDWAKAKSTYDSKCNLDKLSKKADNAFLYTKTKKASADSYYYKFNSGNYPVEYCQGIAGPYPSDYKYISSQFLKKAQYCKDIAD